MERFRPGTGFVSRLPAGAALADRESQAILGVDVGGTFTDLILVDDDKGQVSVAKVPSTPHNQAFGVISAIEATGSPLEDVTAIVHGTTVTTTKGR